MLDMTLGCPGLEFLSPPDLKMDHETLAFFQKRLMHATASKLLATKAMQPSLCQRHMCEARLSMSLGR